MRRLSMRHTHVPREQNLTPAVVQPLDNPRDVDFLTLALLPTGGVAIGTGNIGELYTSQPEGRKDFRRTRKPLRQARSRA